MGVMMYDLEIQTSVFKKKPVKIIKNWKFGKTGKILETIKILENR